MKETWINGRWPLLLPDHRAARPEWPWWESARIGAMHHFIRAGDTVLDIGAEEGDMTALWASWGADVLAVEPCQPSWPCLRATFEANNLTDRVAGWFVGMCGDEPNDLPGEIGSGLDGWPACAYGEMVGDHGFHHLGEHSDVDAVVTADELVGRFGVVPDVVTMDVEGGELAVLRGMAGLLSDARPVVFVSVHHDFMADLYGQDSADLFAFMDSAGYDRTYLATDHEQHELFLPR